MVKRHGLDTVLTVDGTLVPTHDRTVTAPSKNYRNSVNIQVVIDAGTRLVVAVGRPVPGNHNDCTAYRDSGADTACRGAHVMADGGYQGNRQVIMPYQRRAGGGEMAGWQVESNTVHKRARARVEHAFAQMKVWNIVRNCRRKRDGVLYATRGITLMRNLIWLAEPTVDRNFGVNVPDQHILIITGRPLAAARGHPVGRWAVAGIRWCPGASPRANIEPTREHSGAKPASDIPGQIRVCPGRGRWVAWDSNPQPTD